MNKIFELSQEVINKIAAGEVVERPASVIKELIENSIDANANKVEIWIDNGGKNQIKIIDNGSGMNKEDAEKSYLLHTTSKIKNIEDLNNIYSLGFRGEALASISAISEMIIHTSMNDSEGVELIVENSKLTSEKMLPRRKGTTITVRDIFRHLPARKKFLRSDSTEYRYCLAEIYKIALSRPEVEIILYHNSKLVTELPRTESLKKRICALFNSIKEDNLVAITYLGLDYKMSGFVLHPSKLTSDRTKQYLFLNNRFIVDKSLNKAIKEGYKGLITNENNPVYFISIDIDPSKIDVNIHPRKLEAKIENSQDIYKNLKYSISNALSTNTKTNLNREFSSFARPTQRKEPFENNLLNDSGSKKINYDFNGKTNTSFSRSNPISESMNFTRELLTSNSIEFNAFQIFNTYIVIEKKDKLQLIDQHAADERVNYERMLKKINTNLPVEMQNLLLPVNLELSIDKITSIENNLELFKSVGLDIDIFGKDSIKINALPVFAREINYSNLINEILNELDFESSDELLNIKHKLAASVACHGSIRAGKKLSSPEMKRIIENLFDCEHPYSCPHGRPIVWDIEKSEIEKKFLRIK